MTTKKTKGIRYRRDRKSWEHRKYFHGTIYSGLHPTEAAAREALADVNRHIEKLRRIPANSLNAVINDFLVRSRTVGKSEMRIKALIYNFKRFITPHFGADTPMSAISSSDVEKFVARMKTRAVSNSTIWHYVVDLSALFNHYLTTFQVPMGNPVKLANLSAIKHRRVVKAPFDPKAVELAMACLNKPDDFQDWLYVFFTCCTGSRRGEVNRTQWSDLFLDDVESAWLRIPGTKTANSVALNPLPPALARALIAWRSVSKSETVFPGRSAQTRGKAITRRNATFAKIRRRTGIKLTSKDLRDYYASMVDTTDVRTLKELMRHASLATTTTYSRRREDLMREAINKLGVNFGVNEPVSNPSIPGDSVFQGNQYIDRTDWLSTGITEEKSGGGGQSRTVDAADMSRVSVPITKH